MTDTMTEIFGDVISQYTRADALADGVLVDVSTVAKEAGIKFPVALTRAVWDLCVELPDGEAGRCQDVNGRLWDVLWMLRVAIRRGMETDRLNYHLYVRNTDREKLDHRDVVHLKALCHGGDYCEPVITVMLPDES